MNAFIRNGSRKISQMMRQLPKLPSTTKVQKQMKSVKSTFIVPMKYFLGNKNFRLMPKSSVLRILGSTSSVLSLNNVLALAGISQQGLEELGDGEDDDSYF